MRSKKIKLIITLALAITLPALNFNFKPAKADQPNSQAERQALEAELQAIEEQIVQYEKELAATKAQKNTLANKISQLKKQQATLQLQIKATTLKIDSLTNQLEDTQTNINNRLQQIDNLRRQMSEYILLIRRFDDIPWWYRLATSPTLADVFQEFEIYSQMLRRLQDLLKQINLAKLELEHRQDELAEQQDDAQNLLNIKTLQQSKLTSSVKAQNTLYQQTKGREANYTNILTDAKRQANEIRNRIYQLLNVSTQITFGQAVQIAQWIADQTGIRPAFLLAILTQESNLGKNVGTCNRSGDPPAKSWRVIMKPERDQQPFMQITKELSLDPEVTPVSCPMRDKNGQQIGWGGAMGPAQFIPSTWLGYRDKVSRLTGKATANPWDIRDAFAAAAIKLRYDGADGSRPGEWNAAMRYFSGSTNAKYRFYGDNVMTLADGYQEDIDQLNKK